MYKNSGIKKAMFTTNYEGTSGSSWIEFGKLKGNYESYYQWADMPDGSDRWNLKIISSNYELKTSVGVICDAGSSYTHGPDSEVSGFVSWLN